MMQKSIVLALFLVLGGIIGPGGAAAEETVALEDLALLPGESLDTLKDVHHRVALAEIDLAGAEALKEPAKKEIEAAKKEVDVEDSDRKAAEAELKAARKNRDDARVREAESRFQETNRILDTAKLRVQWKEQEVKVIEARIEAAKVAFELRKAERELARAELVVTARLEHSSRYSISRFRNEVDKDAKELLKKQDRVREEEAKAAKLQADWTARSGS